MIKHQFIKKGKPTKVKYALDIRKTNIFRVQKLIQKWKIILRLYSTHKEPDWNQPLCSKISIKILKLPPLKLKILSN